MTGRSFFSPLSAPHACFEAYFDTPGMSLLDLGSGAGKVLHLGLG